MTQSVPLAARGPEKCHELPVPYCLPVPHYVETVYWWAYMHPFGVQFFEREWLVNLILFGNYDRLSHQALADLGVPLRGRTLQIACVYGGLTSRLRETLAPGATLEVVDILPIQLENLLAKLPPDDRVTIRLADSSSLAAQDSSFDQVLLFFLLHEQPLQVRCATLAEALRVVRPGGKIVIVDYHRPQRWHPLRPLVQSVFSRLEPYAIDLWRYEIAHFLPRNIVPASVQKETYFGGLFQKVVLTR